jgi:hypothetical protein
MRVHGCCQDRNTSASRLRGELVTSSLTSPEESLYVVCPQPDSNRGYRPEKPAARRIRIRSPYFNTLLKWFSWQSCQPVP